MKGTGVTRRIVVDMFSQNPRVEWVWGSVSDGDAVYCASHFHRIGVFCYEQRANGRGSFEIFEIVRALVEHPRRVQAA